MALAFSSAQAADPPEPFAENFENTDTGSQPNSVMVLEGDYKVEEVDSPEKTKAFALAGQPVGDFNFLFGPRQAPPVEIKLRVLTEKQGRRQSRFGIGWGGENGLRMLVTPAAKKVELYDNLDKLVEIPFDWKSGMWCELSLAIKQQDGKWVLTGFANQPGSDAGGSQIYAELKEEPRPARASGWGTPYAGNPIYFDDLEVNPAKK